LTHRKTSTEDNMPAASLAFTRQFAGVVLAALVPVVLTAFISIPMSLGGHPGEVRAAADTAARHMT
jgi:hypothetical protein